LKNIYTGGLKMFDFFKKKKPEEKQEIVIEITEEQKNELKEKIERLTIEVNELEATDPQQAVELAATYEEIGLSQAELGEVDQAIGTLEKSLAVKLSIGDGYKKLMSLYNAKRAEAARNGDGDGIDKYMGKMDEMRQIAKKVTISG